MSMKNTVRSMLLAAGLAACLGGTAIAAAPGTSFTYQGVLKNNGVLVGSTVDVTFRLFDAATGGAQVGSSIVRSVTPEDGVFSESLDFGAAAHAMNQAMWIEIEVDGDLLGRQALEATPYALNTRGINVAASGEVGIGAADPGRKLHLRGTNGVIRVDRSDFEPAIDFHDFDDSDDTFQGPALANWYMAAGNAGFTVDDRTAGMGTSTSRFYIDRETGNVGMSTRDPQRALHVRSTGGVIRVDRSDFEPAIDFFDYNDSDDAFEDPFEANWYVSGGASGFSIADRTGTPSTRFFIDRSSTGNVGIGTQTPATKLDVNGAITIRGGADIVEGFDSSCGTKIEPGTLMVIDPEHPGKLMPSTTAYDGKVAGVVSGANGVNPGIKLGQDGVMDGDVPVAMTGRVYVKASAENGAIQPGDMLTTASLAGHAMKATDRDRWDGAVIGKAMSSLDEKTGLVLVLVNLQ